MNALRNAILFCILCFVGGCNKDTDTVANDTDSIPDNSDTMSTDQDIVSTDSDVVFTDSTTDFTDSDIHSKDTETETSPVDGTEATMCLFIYVEAHEPIVFGALKLFYHTTQDLNSTVTVDTVLEHMNYIPPEVYVRSPDIEAGTYYITFVAFAAQGERDTEYPRAGIDYTYTTIVRVPYVFVDIGGETFDGPDIGVHLRLYEPLSNK